MQNLAYFRVTINRINGTSPSDGFIDPKPLNDYMTFDQETGELTGLPTSSVLALAKARANQRFEIVKEQLGLILNVLGVFEIDIEGADINTPPTSVSFTVVYDRPSYLNIEDTLNPGTFLEDAAAVARFVETALTIDRTITYEVFLPITDTDPNEAHVETINLEIGALVDNLSDAIQYVTATRIANTDSTEGVYRSNA